MMKTNSQKLKNRILDLFKYADYSPDELCKILFVDRKTIQDYLYFLHKEGTLYRRFFHNQISNKPDYKYSYYKHAKYTNNPETALCFFVGNWDAMDIRRAKI